MSSKLLATVMTLTFVLAGCSGDSAPPVQDAPPPPAKAVEVIDDDLSYRNEPLLTEIGAPAYVFDSPEPGEADLGERSFENSPPIIPHNVDDFLPITAAENLCTDCHLPEEAVEAEATSIPASHLYDIRRDTELQGLAGANYNCTQCHATQANTDALVENTFSPYYRAEEQKSSSNLLDILNEGVE